ncbi:MAG TPA: hypothetical protein PK907_04540, partial [Candidatus Sabulitectum sp.]|nr:hypothetical protein [Candidatus Sabulitectum sp.]
MFRYILLLSLLLLSCSREVVEAPSAAETSLDRARVADSLLSEGQREDAAQLYLSAALLLSPGTPERINLAERALEASDGAFPAAARVLLESAGSDPHAPYRALREGGSALCSDLLPGFHTGAYRLSGHLALMAAESIVTLDPVMAETLLSFSGDLPGSAGEDLLLCRYRAALGTGDIQGQEESWRAAQALDSDELMARFFHHRGMALGEQGIPDLLRSFQLWPAGDMHAAAYAFLRDTILTDAVLAAAVADPFSSGGLWNEAYDIALNSAD